MKTVKPQKEKRILKIEYIILRFLEELKYETMNYTLPF